MRTVSYNNIILDLGGIILNIDYLRTERAFKELGILNFDEVYSQAKQDDLFNQFEEGKISADTFRKALQHHVPHASFSDIDNAWNAMLLDFPKNRISILRELGDNHRLFVLSNTNEIHEKKFKEIIESECGYDVFASCFEQIYFSHQLGLRKPKPECFRQVMAENSLQAEQTLFIDDSIQHVEGAKSVGIDAVHVPKGGLESYFG